MTHFYFFLLLCYSFAEKLLNAGLLTKTFYLVEQYNFIMCKKRKEKNITAAIKGHFVDHPKNEQQSLSDELIKKFLPTVRNFLLRVTCLFTPLSCPYSKYVAEPTSCLAWLNVKTENGIQ